jgi:ketosteroid isomerase-like protein
MSNENADLIRRAYQAYAEGDLAAMLEFVDPDLEWTYLDPTLEHPTPQVCRGHELEQVLQHWAEHSLRAELDEVTSSGELVMVGVRTPRVDAPTTAGAGTTAPTECSRSARDGSLLCATAAIGRRPSSLPVSGREQPPLAAPRRPPGHPRRHLLGGPAAWDRWRPVALAGLDPVATAAPGSP